MADVASALASWSGTSSSNSPSGATNIGTGLDDNLREIQGAVVRGLSFKGSDIASATTTDLGAVEGLMHDITGTVTITGFGTVRAGIWKIIKFEGALTLTHNATSLILPGGANITTADGDIAIVSSEGSGNWRCASYFKASGIPALGTRTANTFFGGPTSGAAAVPTFRALVGADGASRVLLDTQTASNSAALNFTTGISSTYDAYILELVALVPGTGSVNLTLQYSIDGGSNWVNAAASYAYTISSSGANGTDYSQSSTGDTKIILNGGTNVLSSTAASGGVSGEIKFYNLASTTQSKTMRTNISYAGSVAYGRADGMGVGQSATLQGSAVNGIRLIMDSGNIATGVAYLYGIRKT